MFHNIKIKLTFTSVILTGLLFLSFVTGVFFVLERSIISQNADLVTLISSAPENYYGFPDSPHKDHIEHQYKYFHVIINPWGNIVSASNNLDIKNKHFLEIVSKAVNCPKTVDKISCDDEQYYFIKKNLNNTFGKSIFFVNAISEENIHHKLFGFVLVSAIAGLILALFTGLFMSNRFLIPIRESWDRERSFIADASHELRTPLSVINTTIDLLMSRPDQTIGSQFKWLDNIQTENKRMIDLINDLLLLAKTDSNQELLVKELFALHTAILEVYIPFEAIALQKNIQLDKFKCTPIEFFGDESKIKQLVVILIDNAFKYTPAGGNIGMSVTSKGDSVEIAVSDTGEGIAKEHLNKIFNRFYRVDKSRSRNFGSAGLGLSIAEWIVREHGGSIRVESVQGSGSTFRIILPKLKH